jgi:hypothetical protein
LRQTGLHWKIGFWEIDGVFVSAHEKYKPLTAAPSWVNDPSFLYRFKREPENGFLDRVTDSKRSEERIPKAERSESI